MLGTADEGHAVSDPMFRRIIDPGHLGSRSQFRASVDRVIETVKNSALAVGFDEVLVPGEPEQRNLARSDQHGLVVPSRLRADLSSLAVELGIVIEW